MPPRDIQPLSGLRVLDLTSVIYGPYATQILGDFGADVIKIEPPEGDMVRAIGPARNPKMSALFLGSNRNKRSLVLDLKRDEDKHALWRLIENADVFVHNMRPKKIAALGFNPDAVLACNPRIIYGGLHGYQEDGPYAGMPAYDDVIQGQSGVVGAFMVRDGEPVLMPTIIADKTAALLASNGLMAAIIRRGITGKGGYVETSMFEGMVGYILLEHQHGAVFVPPLGKSGYPRALSPHRRPHSTADGYICMLAYTDKQWRSFWQLSGRPELGDDPRFVDVGNRTRNIDELYQIAAKALATKTTKEWLALLRHADVPAGPVNQLEDLRNDEHLNAINFFKAFEHPTEGKIEVLDSPYRFDRKSLPLHRHQPQLGEHSREILAEAGLSDEEIEAIVLSE